jgi:large subunit ribosomal protein L25
MEATLEGIKRESRGKNEARRLREVGRIPAVVYGGATEGLPIAVDPKVLSRILHSESGVNTLISLSVDGSVSKVLVTDFQLDPVSHQLLHADFFRVAMDKRIVVSVPVELKGEARGVKQQGGVLDFVTRDVEVECLPADIPEHIDVDVSEMLIGDSVRVSDLAGGEKWIAVSEPETMLVHVVPPHVEKEPEPEAAAVAAEPAAAAEPEVIKKGKTEKEEE